MTMYFVSRKDILKRRTCVNNLNNKIREEDNHTGNFYTGSAKTLAYF